MRLGVHVSIAGGLDKGVERAVELGCDTFQCFGGNPRGWKQRPLREEDALRFKEARKASGIGPVAIHASYLINIASPDDDLYRRSIELLTLEMERAGRLGVEYLVLHGGSPRGGGVEFARARVSSALEEVGRRTAGGSGVELLLENTAGGGTTVGATLAEIGDIIASTDEGLIKLGFCFDTCHAFAAGLPMSSAKEVAALVSSIGSEVGAGRLRLIHLNDSLYEAASRRDRHAHIGKGKIGKANIKALLRSPALCDIPVVLETPKDTDEADKENMAVARKLAEGPVKGYKKQRP